MKHKRGNIFWKSVCGLRDVVMLKSWEGVDCPKCREKRIVYQDIHDCRDDVFIDDSEDDIKLADIQLGDL